MTGKDRKVKTDYAKLKKLHPKAKVGNIKRLIRAIGNSGHWEAEMLDACRKPRKVGGRALTLDMAKDAISSTENLGKTRVPMTFDMTDFMYVPRIRRTGGPSCGTAACIAGFAGALASRGSAAGDCRLDGLLRNKGSKVSWVGILADFMGIDKHTANKMISVGCHEDFNDNARPRHAVKLLEIFLATGNVDWRRAMGRKRGSGDAWVLTRAEERMRNRDQAIFEKLDAEILNLSHGTIYKQPDQST